MLQINNLTIKTYKDRFLVSECSFVCNKKDKIAIIGEEGNGKSTLLKAIVDFSLIESYAQVSGKIDKQNHLIAYLPQQLDSSWNQTEIFDFLLLKNPNDEIEIEQYNQINELSNYFQTFNLDKQMLYSNQLMGQCSGGEKIKLQLIKLIRQQPDVLLLDEPTNDLDLETLLWLENFIINQEMIILFISHDETLLENCATSILHLEQVLRKSKPRCTFVRMGYEQYVTQRLHLMTRQNNIAAKEKSEYDKKMERYRQLYQKVEHQQATISRQDPHGGQLLKKKMKSIKAMGRRFEAEELVAKVEIEEEIQLRFKDEVKLDHRKCILHFSCDELAIGDKVLAHNIQLDLFGNDSIVIIGRNGSGKSTLIRLIQQQIETQNHVLVGYIPQNYEESLPLDLSPVSFLVSNHDKEYQSMVQTRLGSLKFTSDEMLAPMSSLSKGQQAKILLLKLVIEGAEVLILDEPTRNLSPLSNPVIRGMLMEFKGCIIGVSHDRKFIDEVGKKIYELDEQGLHLLADKTGEND